MTEGQIARLHIPRLQLEETRIAIELKVFIIKWKLIYYFSTLSMHTFCRYKVHHTSGSELVKPTNPISISMNAAPHRQQRYLYLYTTPGHGIYLMEYKHTDVTYESIARHNLKTFKWKSINHDAKEMNGNNECWIAAYFPQENANFQIACDYFMRKLYKICF